MDKYTIAPPSGSTNNSVGAADRPWHEGHFDSVKLNGGDLGEYLAESTGYGIVSGCTPSINGLTVTVAAGVVHLADGTRKEIPATNITLDAADSTNPRIDLVYITSAGEVAKVTGTASASPVVPSVPTGGISVCNVTIAAGASTGTVNRVQTIAPNLANYGIVNVKDYGAKGDGITDDTTAFEVAISTAENNTLFIPNGNYKINSTLIADKAKSVVNNGNYTGVEPIYPIGPNLSKMALNLEHYVSLDKPSVAGSTSTIRYYCQSVGYNPDTDHVLLVYAGYTISTGDNDQPGKVIEMSADYQTVINSATIDVGHGNGCCYCSKDGKWYIATGKSELGVIVLNSDLTLDTSHLLTEGNPWTIEYDNAKDIFYVQTGHTGVEYNAKINIYSYDWSLLSYTALKRVKNRYGTGYLTSQDATLINGDYAFLYYSSTDISITTYDMLTGAIKEQAVFDNLPNREPEGIYVKNNQLYIVSVTDTDLMVYTVLLNNVANPRNEEYGPGETITITTIKGGYFTEGRKAYWGDFIALPMLCKNVKSISLEEAHITIRQNGNYILQDETDLSPYNIEVNINKLVGNIIISKKDGTEFSNTINNGEAAMYMYKAKLRLH